MFVAVAVSRHLAVPALQAAAVALAVQVEEVGFAAAEAASESLAASQSCSRDVS